MSVTLLLPAASALTIALAISALHRRVRPRTSAALLMCAILGVAAAVVPAMIVLALGFLIHLPHLGGGFDWCRTALGLHASVNPWLGGAASVLVAVGAYRVGRSLRAWRRHRCVESGAPALVDSDEWFAYSLPGPGRRIAVSSGLVGALDGEELAVVLAHERGHALNRHDRHLLAAEVVAGLVPVVEPMRRRLRFALERWADETAVEAVGGDRQRVAVTLAKVAMRPADLPDAVAAFDRLGVAARVEALLWPAPVRRQGVWCSMIGVGVLAVVAAAAVQAHHLVGALVALCPG